MLVRHAKRRPNPPYGDRELIATIRQAMHAYGLFLLSVLIFFPVDTCGAVLDQGFDPNANGDVLAIATQPDGKIIIGGEFTSIAGVTRNYLARLNSDGTLDTAFDPNPSRDVCAIAVQSDDKILISGLFTSVGGGNRSYLARLNPDGTLDSSFTSNPGGPPSTLAIQPDRKILIGGTFLTSYWAPKNLVARLHPDGSLDTGFSDVFPGPYPPYGYEVRQIALQPDGKILLGGNLPGADVIRLLPDGTRDSSFNEVTFDDGDSYAVGLQPDGKILVGGYFRSIGGVTKKGIARFHPNGSLDPAFGIDMQQTGVIEIAIQPDGKIVIGGDFSDIGGDYRRDGLARLNSDGSLDTAAFQPGAHGSIPGVVEAIAIQPDGKILLGGSFLRVECGGVTAPVTRNHIARFSPDGLLEVPFAPSVSPTNSAVSAVAVQPDGKILIGGDFTSVGGVARNGIARLRSNGALDTSFTPGVYAYRDDSTGATTGVSAIAVQPDGYIVIGGSFTTTGGAPRNRVARLKPDGSLDSSFVNIASLHDIYAIALQNDGKILLARSRTVDGATDGQVLRLNSDGSPDLTFAYTTTDSYVMALAIQADGKILVGGSFSTIGGGARNRLARLEANGALDATLTTSVDNGSVYAIAVQPDGRILIGGSFSSVGSDTRRWLARLDSNGALEAEETFNANLDSYWLNAVFSIAVQPDDKIVIGGVFGNVGVEDRIDLARLNPNGTLDSTVNAGISNGRVLAVALQPDGKIVIGGSLYINLGGGESLGRLARLADAGLASQDLTANPNGFVITWFRSGAGPELSWTTFESSPDRAAWSFLNYGHRVGTEPVWDLAGLSPHLPRNQNLYLRARGYYSESHSYSMLESLRLFYLTNRPPVILSHPVSTTVAAGNSVSFNSTADSYPYSPVKWQVKVSATSTWTDIFGATSTTYTHTAAAGENNYMYRAVFTNSEGSTASDPATLTVTTPPLGIAPISGG
ncbi:MAG: hypothetical protein EHM61_25440 [Acidobacteria bacterium]|nr:MAG: hypothetical protein EHM61_25440 [Acidobacteriota bacterium]